MIRTVNPLENHNWNKALLSYPGTSFFHTSTWAKVLQMSYFYRPLYLTMACNGQMAILPIMEVKSLLTGKKGVSLPFTDSCEPIVSNDEQFQELFSHVIYLGKKNGWKYIEFRGGEKFLYRHEPSECYFGHTLDLTEGAKKLFSKFRDSTKRNIQKAEKAGVSVEITNSLKAVDEFCRLNSLTRRDHGLPPQPHRFFKNIHEKIISKRMGFILLATYNNITIAGNVYFQFGQNVTYKYGASDKDYQHLRPNNLVMWQAIKWSCENGYKNLCFGRTETANEGLRRFKSGWGTKEHIIKYYKYDFSKASFINYAPRVSDFQHKVFKKLPIPVLNALGTLLYKHVG